MIIIVRHIAQGRYRAYLGQRYLCTSIAPLVASARILQAEGNSAQEPLELMHEGDSKVFYSTTIGQAAALIIEPHNDAWPLT